jgi:hypothetical protein
VGFHAYINEVQGSRSNIPSKNLVHIYLYLYIRGDISGCRRSSIYIYICVCVCDSRLMVNKRIHYLLELLLVFYKLTNLQTVLQDARFVHQYQEPNTKFKETPTSESRVVSCERKYGQTDLTKLIVLFAILRKRLIIRFLM